MKVEDYISIVSTSSSRLFNHEKQGIWEGIQKYYPNVKFYFYHENSFELKHFNMFIDFDAIGIPSTYQVFDLFNEVEDLEYFLDNSKFNLCKTFDNRLNGGYWKRNSIFWFRKVVAMYCALKVVKTPLLLFLDADSFITPAGSNTSPDEYTIDENYINWGLEHDVLSRHRKGMATESGHLVFNLKKRGLELITEFYNFYREEKFFNQKRWDDGFIFDVVCKETRVNNGPLSKRTGAPYNFESIVDHNKGSWYNIRDRFYEN